MRWCGGQSGSPLYRGHVSSSVQRPIPAQPQASRAHQTKAVPVLADSLVVGLADAGADAEEIEEPSGDGEAYRVQSEMAVRLA